MKLESLESVVEFTPSTHLQADVQAIGHTSLHLHSDALEIVYVLRGELQVAVVCEHFDLRVGDFVVINRGDPHLLTGSADNVTAVVHANLSAFVEVDPLVEHVVYACESFDLARHRHQEALLRGLLLDIIDGDAGQGVELMRILCAGYSLEDYYNRGGTITGPQRTKFRTIVRYLWEHAAERDVLDIIAEKEHYSKSYISHVVKDVAGVSFTDLLVYFRVARAEKLLLSTEATMLEIAAQCGFSDVKYFTRSFVNWFHESPADYRRSHQPDILRDSDIREVSARLSSQLLREHRRPVAAGSEGPRLSVTPLLLKNLGSRRGLFAAAPDDAPRSQRPKAKRGTGVVHLVPVRVTMADLEQGYLLDGLPSFDQIDTTPCLVLEYSTRAVTTTLVVAVAERLEAMRFAKIPIWLTYNTIHDRDGVDHIVTETSYRYGLSLLPILTP